MFFKRNITYKLSPLPSIHNNPFFTHFFGGLECVDHSFVYVAHFEIFERCLDSNP